jgi:pilus assembly protein CpaB
MNRRARTSVVLFVALLAAAATSYGVYAALIRIPVREVEIATRHAVVAAKAMPIGALLTTENVKLVDWPAATPLEGGFDSLEEVVGRGLITSVVTNEPIAENKVAPREAGAGLPPAIPPGMRAMSVKVNEVIGVAGFVVPGTHVDVMVIFEQKEEAISRVVVSNVQVLTAGTKLEQDNAADAKPIPSTVVTLLVTPQDAERIALAQSEGQLMLSLRNPTDVAPTQTAGARTASLFGEPPAPVRAAPRRVVAATPVEPPALPPPPRIYTVEAIRAAKRSEEVVK